MVAGGRLLYKDYFKQMHQNLRDQRVHLQLLTDLIEHMRTHDGNLSFYCLIVQLKTNFMFELCIFSTNNFYLCVIFMCMIDMHGFDDFDVRSVVD